MEIYATKIKTYTVVELLGQCIVDEICYNKENIPLELTPSYF